MENDDQISPSNGGMAKAASDIPECIVEDLRLCIISILPLRFPW
jgi:hypothetical protein